MKDVWTYRRHQKEYESWQTLKTKTLIDNITGVIDMPITMILSQNKVKGWQNIIITRGTQKIVIPETRCKAIIETLHEWGIV